MDGEEIVCRYAVVRAFGPWQQGWHLLWNVTDSVVSVVACTDDRRVVGCWGPDMVPVLMRALFVERALHAEYIAPAIAAIGAQETIRARDFSAGALEVVA